MLPWSRAAKQYDDALGALNSEWVWIVREVRNKKAPTDGAMPMWMQLKNLEDLKTGKPLDDKNLRAKIAGVVLAGMESTAQQPARILCLSASHSHVVDTLMKELKEYELHIANDREASFRDLGELSYLSEIIKEGMRIAYVASSSLIRIVPEDMMILGNRVPKGTVINAAGTRASAALEEWGDPDVFRPERWLRNEDMSMLMRS